MQSANQSALMFLLRHPDVYRKCREIQGDYSNDPIPENEAKMKEVWEGAKALYLKEQEELIDKAWVECLGVSVS